MDQFVRIHDITTIISAHKRVIIVGDLHGTIDEFLDLLDLVKYDISKDLVISVGDVCDRGRDPLACFRWFKKYGLMVLSNHESKHLRYRRHTQKKLKDPSYKHPMKPFSSPRKEEHESYTDQDIDYLDYLPHVIKYELHDKKYVVVHAGISPKAFSLEGQYVKEVIRIRKVTSNQQMISLRDEHKYPDALHWSDYYDGRFGTVIHGHDASPDGVHVVKKHSINLDSAAVFGHRLTCMIQHVHEDIPIEFYSVKARKVYFSQEDHD